MSIIIKDGRFGNSSADEAVYRPIDSNITDTNAAAGLDIPSDISVSELSNRVGNVSLLRIAFPSPADGRGFSIAKTLRHNGYKGHLRAYGHVLADQYPLALRCGFDDVEISRQLADRQPEDQWEDSYSRRTNTYQEKLSAPHRKKAIAA